ncbi:HAD-IIA family hydrolase [Candidatus Solincola tengchongensis]|uniref:HAD-IIA family hydrolase n=1 Tax=Candidatus Solincola tengchongensis TaxID=2900693 RepID=UPI00257F7FFC|nr:HAD-IIA family hydrolase [Candidatus Solincola tengchongensis]
MSAQPELPPVIERYQAFLVDMDGVVYLDREPVAGAADFVQAVRREKKKLLFLTNNSKFTRAEYREKLAGVGIPASEEEVLTSAAATADFLRENYDLGGSTAFVIGGRGLEEEIAATGLRLLRGEEAKEAGFVIVGWDTDLTYDKLRLACLALHRGAVFIGTNPDATFPSPEGLWPGAGAIIAALERAAGREALVVGKPNLYMMQVALNRVGEIADRTLVIGDRLDTDILGGWRAGMDTCLVLTGVTRRKDLEGRHPQPDLVVENLRELL